MEPKPVEEIPEYKGSGKPRDVDSSYVTGQVPHVDAGMETCG